MAIALRFPKAGFGWHRLPAGVSCELDPAILLVVEAIFLTALSEGNMDFWGRVK
jgi:hypothetical protein